MSQSFKDKSSPTQSTPKENTFAPESSSSTLEEIYREVSMIANAYSSSSVPRSLSQSLGTILSLMRVKEKVEFHYETEKNELVII